MLKNICAAFLVAGVFLMGACGGGEEATDTTSPNDGNQVTDGTDSGTPPTPDVTGPQDQVAPQDTAPPQDNTPPQDTTPPPQGDGNDNFSEAQAVVGGTEFQGGIGQNDDQDYFKFTGVKGDVIMISTDAKPDDDPYADGYADLVVTLYDANEVQIAVNDDPIPRYTQDSRLITVLPEDGDYYIRVSDFCHWATVETGSNPCDISYVITNPTYTVVIDVLSFESGGNHDETEGMTITYEGSTSGAGTGYFATIVKGTFDSADETDVYDFTLPTDLVYENDLEASFVLYPAGIDASGSTAPISNAWITDDVSNVLSKLPGSSIDKGFGAELMARVDPGTTYKIHVETSGDPGSNGFYLLWHFGSGSNPMEINDALNGQYDSADTIPMVTTAAGNPAYYVAGNIINNGMDQDHFKLDLANVAPGLKISCSCAAANNGSGLEGLSLALLKADGSMLHTSTENATDNANCGNDGISIPAGADHIFLRVTASGQSDEIVGDFYRCGVQFNEPNN